MKLTELLTQFETLLLKLSQVTFFALWRINALAILLVNFEVSKEQLGEEKPE